MKDYSPFYLKRPDNYISRALVLHIHSAFSLTIIEFIMIKNWSLKETRKLILSREQFYIDSLEPNNNILKVAGSLLGYRHTEDSFTKFS